MARNGIVGCSRLARLESTFLVRTVNVDWLVLGLSKKHRNWSQAPPFCVLPSVQEFPWFYFSFTVAGLDL